MLLGFGASRPVEHHIQRQIVAELQQPGVIEQLILTDRHITLLQLPVNTGSALCFILLIFCQLRILLAGHFNQPFKMQAAQQRTIG
ncbi:hypothetical protein D3C71_1747560 [compost metagenome]